MLTVLLNWFYMIFAFFCLGFAFSLFTGKALHYSIKRVDSILIAGLAISTVYAQIFSLFYRVNIEANVVLVIFCIVVCVLRGKQMMELLMRAWKSNSWIYKVLLLLLFLVWGFFTSRGYRTVDMDLYHGQSIRWIEEYGVVKGIGNLHGRFGYNSSLFAVSALYSMKFLLGRSLHGVNGLIAFLLSVNVLEMRKCFKRRKMLLSDYARAGAAYYLSTIWDEVIAPSSDYAVMCVIFLIVIKWLTQLEAEEGDRNLITPYALLCVLGAYAITLKLSAGFILLLILKPAYVLLKEKRWKEIGIYLLMGLITATPWLTRNVLITGWLIYPFAALDLFQVDWKILDVGAIRTDAFQIEIWAKGANHLGVNATFDLWFPNWFQNELSVTEKLLIAADIASCVMVLGMGAVVLFRRQWRKLDVMLVLLTVMCCYLFWQFSAPMMRYGYAHVLLLAALCCGYVLERVKLAGVAYVFLLLYGGYKLYVGYDYILGCCRLPHYVWQETYETYELEQYELDGVTLYYSPSGGCVGYDLFPAIPMAEYGVELRGEGLKDGFRQKSDGNTP